MNKSKFEELNNKESRIRKIQEKKSDCQILKKIIIAEEEGLEKETWISMQINNEMEDDWKRKDLIIHKEYLFEEENFLLKKIEADRKNMLQEDCKEIKQYLRELQKVIEEENENGKNY